MMKLQPSCMCGKDRDCVGTICQCGDTSCECERAAERRRMRPPQQTFDVLLWAHFRIRGTQAQIVETQKFLIELMRATERGCPLPARLSGAGPSGENSVGWWAEFQVVPRYVDAVRIKLTELGLKEER